MNNSLLVGKRIGIKSDRYMLFTIELIFGVKTGTLNFAIFAVDFLKRSGIDENPQIGNAILFKIVSIKFCCEYLIVMDVRLNTVRFVF